MWYNFIKVGRARSGQAMVEYVIVFAFLTLFAVTAFLLLVSWRDRNGQYHKGAIERYGERAEALVTSDCP